MNDPADHPTVIAPWLPPRVPWQKRLKPRDLSVAQPEKVLIHKQPPFGGYESH